MKYRVIRDFPGARKGQELEEGDFLDASRAQYLVTARYITPIVESDEEAILISTPIRLLRERLPELTDADVLRRALASDGRVTAQRMYLERLEELE